MGDAELDTFLEMDIARYLENQLAPPADEGARPVPDVPVVFLTRDYERELNEALDADEISRAKRVLHDLKERFDEAPDGTAEKNQIKTLLIALYERFRMRLEHDDDQDRTDIDIARLMRSWGIQPIEPVVPAPPEELFSDERMPSRRSQRRAPRAPPAVTPEPLVGDRLRATETERESLITHANRLLDTVEERLRAGDLQGAVRVYRETRRDVLAVDGGVRDDLAQRFFDAHARLHEAIRALTGHDAPPVSVAPEPSGAKQRAPSNDAMSMFDQSILDALSARKRDLDAAVARNDIAGAMREYDAMRTAALHLRDAERQAGAARKLRALHELLTRLRHAADGRGLSRAVP